MVKGITHILKQTAGVQSLVGLNAAGDKYKVYPVVCPQGEKAPYIVVFQTGKTPIECKGVATSYVYTYDVYSVHTNYDTAEGLDAAVVDALNFKTAGTYNSVVFQEIRHTNTTDGQYNEDQGLFTKVSSFEAMVDED